MIKYRKRVKDAPTLAQYALGDGSTGKVVRYYVPSDELGNNLVCFSKDGFTFLRYEKRRVNLLLAKP